MVPCFSLANRVIINIESIQNPCFDRTRNNSNDLATIKVVLKPRRGRAEYFEDWTGSLRIIYQSKKEGYK